MRGHLMRRGGGRRPNASLVKEFIFSLLAPGDHYFDADRRYLTFDGSNKVSAWFDRMSGAVATQPVGAIQPTTVANDPDYNGEDTILWNTAASTRMIADAVTWEPSPWTIIVYGECDPMPPAASQAWCGEGGATHKSWVGIAPTSRMRTERTDGGGTTTTTETAIALDAIDHLYVYTHSFPNVIGQLRDATQGTPSGIDARAPTVLGTTRLGARADGTLPINGKTAAMAFVRASALTAAQVSALYTKWAQVRWP